MPAPRSRHAALAVTAAVASLIAGSLPAAPPADPAAPASIWGFRPLFNGRDLAGWWGLGTEDPRAWMALDDAALIAKRAASLEDVHAHWRVDDGELVNDGAGLFLTTVDHFDDFELRLEYRAVAGADSGVYLRGIPQVQIWDTTEAGGAGKGSGGLWNNRPGTAGKDPLVRADRPFGEWNRMRIVMVGERVTVHLNDRLVVGHARLDNAFDRETPVPRRGPIQLQTHGGEIRWRNLYVRAILPDEANAILAAHGDEGFEPVFNGTDLAGWSGSTESYEVRDGAIRCRPDHGGTLHTDAIYADFVARLEFRLPPGGNNGLAIRYPGAGDTAYVGMCELQVLDNRDPRYAALDPRQYHGSAYGQVAARRGYLREAGHWNFQEVTVRGSTVRVELNGTVILDTDLATVESFMHEAERFTGRSRTSGHFGFAGHGDPVEYRRVRIRSLDEGDS